MLSSIARFSFVVSWIKLTLEQVNGAITGYNIKVESKDRDTVISAGDVNTYNVTWKVQPNTMYRVAVSAANKEHGSGNFSESVFFKTIQDGTYAVVSPLTPP